jgi:hypothetical protein
VIREGTFERFKALINNVFDRLGCRGCGLGQQRRPPGRGDGTACSSDDYRVELLLVDRIARGERLEPPFANRSIDIFRGDQAITHNNRQ